jgi:hypothetical protein
MKVRIVREPHGTLNGSALSQYRTGEVYDLPVSVGEYLVVEGFAIVEMRNADHPEASVRIERRRSGRRS